MGAQSNIAPRQLAPLNINDALDQIYFPDGMPISLSPDGQWLAYTLQDNRRRQVFGDVRYRIYSPSGVPTYALGCDVFVTNLSTHETKNLTEGKGTSWGPVWSPDSQHLAFYSDRSGEQRVWLWEKSNGALRQVSSGIVRAFFTHEVVRWTPDSKKILAKLLPDEMTVEDALKLSAASPIPKGLTPTDEDSATVTVISSQPTASTNPEAKLAISTQRTAFLSLHLADLALIEIAGARDHRIIRQAHPLGVWLSPDGNYVAFMNAKGHESEDTIQYLFDLVVISLLDGQTRTLASNIRQGQLTGNASWSRDGKFLAYTTYGQLAKGDCFVVPTAGGQPRNITKGTHPNFGDDYRAPMWDEREQTVYVFNSSSLWKASVNGEQATKLTEIPNRTILDIVSSQGGQRLLAPDSDRSLVLVTRDDQTKRVGFYKVDVTAGKHVKLVEEDKSYGDVPFLTMDVSADGKRLAYLAQSSDHNEDIWVADNNLRNPQRATRANPQLDKYVMGRSRVIEWRSVDGQTLHGALLLPAGYEAGKRYPLIVYQYPPASLSDYANHFGLERFRSAVENMQLFATRGYAVLLPDVPVSTGTPMQDIFKAVMPGVDKVIDLGIADPESLGVMGHSYGGYGVLALIVQTTRFKAAINRAGPANYISMYGILGDNGVSSSTANIEGGVTGGTLWEKRDKFIENSPIFYLDKVETPLLIIHGTLDTAVPSFLTDEILVCLRRLGKHVEYANYRKEEHWEGNWSYTNQADYLHRAIGWFDNHLKNDRVNQKTSARSGGS
jgi:dipeptidyl aminopeptidase/acylaminoacyl peptidase